MSNQSGYPRVDPTTPEEAARLDALAALVESERETLPARLKRLRAAAEERSFSGELRRAIRASMIQADELASAAGVELMVFLRFQEGLAELSTAAVDRLVARLGLEAAFHSAKSG